MQHMAKTMRINEIDETTNMAINSMKADYLNEGVEITRPAAMIMIVKEWYAYKKERKSIPSILIAFGKYLLSDERKETLSCMDNEDMIYDRDIDIFLNRK